MRGLTDEEREMLVASFEEMPEPDAPESPAEEIEICERLRHRGLVALVDHPDDDCQVFDGTPLGKLALELDTLAKQTTHV